MQTQIDRPISIHCRDRYRKNSHYKLEAIFTVMAPGKAIVVFSESLDNVFIKFRKQGITKPSISIRTMKKRWGSCTGTGNIILNTELLKASRTGIEYVIIHELCHLLHYNHTKLFFNLLNKVLPDWKKHKEILEHSLV